MGAGRAACDGALACVVGARGASAITGARGCLAVIGSSPCIRRCSSGCRRLAALGWWRHFRLRDHLDGRCCSCRFQLLARAVVERPSGLRCQLRLLRREARSAPLAGRCARPLVSRTRGQAACRPVRHCLARSFQSGPGGETTATGALTIMSSDTRTADLDTGCDCTNVVAGTATTAPGTRWFA